MNEFEELTCINKKSEEIFALKEHALLGVSPFVSYFSEECLEKLFSWALNNFSNMNVFIPDEISAYTLEAIGYPENKAAKKTRRQDNYLKNKVVKALVANGLSCLEAEDKIIFLSKLKSNKSYLQFYDRYIELYRSDMHFRNLCLESSKLVLKEKEGSPPSSFQHVNSLSIAVKYLLAEMPMYLNSADILKVSSSLFVYRNSFPLLREIYDDGLLLSAKQGFLIAKINTPPKIESLPVSKEKIYIDNILRNIPGSIYWKDINGVYLGCNQAEVDMLGLKSPEDIIGKTDYELPWGTIADELRKTDQRIMQTGIPEEISETPTLVNGRRIICLTRKSPLYSDKGDIIGIIGVSVDVTDHKKRAELEIENKIQKTKFEVQEEFVKSVKGVAHDIRSPLIVLSMIGDDCKELSEKDHVKLRNVIVSIENIIFGLLEEYREKGSPADQSPQLYIWPNYGLQDAIDINRQQYKSSNLAFNYSSDPTHNCVFIGGNYHNFCRMISNLLKNSIEAEAKLIDVGFTVKDRTVSIYIKDNGIGMPQEIVDKIMNNIPMKSSKAGGHGLGMQQVRQTVTDMNGSMSIKSEKNVGTEINFTFAECDPPNWFPKEIVVHRGDTVVAMDDDPFVFEIWKRHFEECSGDITLKCFTTAQETIDFINSFADKSKLLLLADYDMRDKSINGIGVIEKTDMWNKAIIVTNSYLSNIKEFNEKCDLIKIMVKQYEYVNKIPVVVKA